MLRKGDLEGALVQFAELIKASPGDDEAEMKVGLLNERLGRNRAAVQVYTGILARNPNFIPAYLALGELQ